MAGLILFVLAFMPSNAHAVPVVAAALVDIGMSTAVATFVATVVVNIAIAMAVQALTPKAKQPNLNQEATDRKQMVRSSIEPHRIIYGKAKVSGPMLLATSTGSSHEYLHLIVALAGHQVESIDDVYLGDKLSADSAFMKGQPQETQVTFRGSSTSSASMMLTIDAVVFNFDQIDDPGRNLYSAITGNADYGSFNYTARLNSVSNDDGDPLPGKVILTAKARGVGFTVSDAVNTDEVWMTITTTVPNDTSSYARFNRHLGVADQAADADLVNEVADWTVDHRLRGIAYLYARLEWNQDAFPNGIPNLAAIVKGRAVYDPRTGTSSWSDNWALCVLDFLIGTVETETGPRPIGAGATLDEIDLDSFIAAANICDEDVQLADGTTQKRYTCNGTFTLDSKPTDTLEQLLTSGAGALVYTQGKYRIFAGAATAASFSLNEDNLRAAMKVRPRFSRQDLYNGVRGTFVDPGNFWEPGDFAPQTNPLYEAQDGDEQVMHDIQLPYTIDPIEAQRIARIILEKSRQGITIDYPCNYTALPIAVFDVVQVTNQKLGWVNKEFRVMEWKLAEEGGVDLTLQEESAAVYDWNSGMQTMVDPAPDTNLPDPNVVAAPGVPAIQEELYQTTASAGVKTKAIISGAPSPDVFARDYQFEYRLTSDTAYTVLPRVSDPQQVAYDMRPGIYEFRVKAISHLGVSSSYAYAAKEIAGLTTAPADLAGFTIAILNGIAQLSWDAHPDLDVRIGGSIVLRHSAKASGATWNDGVDIQPVAGNQTHALVPLLAGTYMAKPRDSSGNFSKNAVFIETDLASVIQFNAVAVSRQDPLFPGAKTNMAAPSGALQLDSVEQVDTMAGDIDTWPLIDTLGGVQLSGAYEFDQVMDLGAIYTSRVTASISALVFDTGDFIDDRTLNIDQWDDIDGQVINDVTVRLLIALTNDDPAGAPIWTDFRPFVVGDYAARGLKFRVEVKNGSSTHNVAISGLSVAVDMPDRVEGQNGADIPASGMDITFDPPFKATPAIGVTIENLSSGDYVEVTNKTQYGFTWIVRDSTGAGVARRGDWLAKGYGRAA